MTFEHLWARVGGWVWPACFLILVMTGCAQSPERKEARFLANGKAMLAKRDFNRAIINFQNASQLMPNDAEPYYQRALVHIEMRSPRQAIASLRKAAELNPNHVGAQLKLAAFLMGSAKQENVADARERIQRVLAANPNDAQAMEMLSIHDLRLGNREDGMANLQNLLEHSPADLKAALNLSKLKLMAKDAAGAEAVLVQAVKAAPQSSMAALALANFYVALGRNAEAEAEAIRAAQLDPTNATVLLALASLQTRAGKNREADETYRRVAALPAPELKPLHAIFLFQLGRREESIAELAKLAQADPDNRALRSLRVSAYVTVGRPNEALALLDAAIRKHPKDTEALLERCDFYLSAGKWNEADRDLQTVMHFRPDSGAAHYGLARVAAARGQDAKARQELGEALRLNPGLLAARTHMARSLLSTRDSKGALDVLNQAPAAQKTALDYIVARNWALIEHGDLLEARQNIDVGLAMYPSPELMFQNAEMHLRQKDYSGARDALEQILKDYPESTAIDRLAQTYAIEGRLEKGVEVVQAYAAKRPKSAYLLYEVGVWQAKAKRPAQARQAFRDALEANQDTLMAALLLAEMDVLDSNLTSARRTLTDVLSRHPGNVRAKYLLGLVEDRSGNRDAAIQSYHAVVEAEPGNADALNNLAYDLYPQQPEEALKLAQRAVEAAPDNPAAQDTLGWISYQQGRYQTALQHFRSAVGKEPTAVRQYHLGLTYAKLGDTRQASENIAAALKRDPKVAAASQ